MKLIIEIDDEMVCNDIKRRVLEPTSATDEVIINALYNGIPYEGNPIESITTKGGMTLSLKKTDIEISDLARCIAMALNDTTVEEFVNKYNMLTFMDNNSGKSVSYRRVDNGEEAENEQTTN